MGATPKKPFLGSLGSDQSIKGFLARQPTATRWILASPLPFCHAQISTAEGSAHLPIFRNLGFNKHPVQLLMHVGRELLFCNTAGWGMVRFRG